MHSRDSCQDYYSDQTMSSLSEREWTVSQSSPLMYRLHSHKPSEENRQGEGRTEQQGWTTANHVLSSNQRRLTSRFPFRLYIVSSLWIWAHRYLCKEKRRKCFILKKTAGLSENSLSLQTAEQQRNCIGVSIKTLGAGSQVPKPRWALLLPLRLGAC